MARQGKYESGGPDHQDAREYYAWLLDEYQARITITLSVQPGMRQHSQWTFTGVMGPLEGPSVPASRFWQAKASVSWPGVRCATMEAALYWLMSDLHFTRMHQLDEATRTSVRKNQ